MVGMGVDKSGSAVPGTDVLGEWGGAYIANWNDGGE